METAEQVQQAFRMGWAVAELRGRYRPAPADWVPTVALPPRTSSELPLGDERSATERLIEIQGELKQLAQALSLDFEEPHQHRTFSESLDTLGNADGSALSAENWRKLAECLYEWDAAIQDDLAMRPELSAGYQLGRGLAETYWMLDPSAGDGTWNGWTFVLGSRRCARLNLCLARVCASIDPLASAAVRSSLQAWHEIAAQPHLRDAADASETLYLQGVLWRDLIRGEQRAGDLPSRRLGVHSVSLGWTLATKFFPQLLLAAISVAALAIAGASLAAGKSVQTSTLGLILGGFGVTAASLLARAKVIANSLVEQIKREFAEVRVGEAATLRPSRPLRAIATGTEVKRLTARSVGRPVN